MHTCSKGAVLTAVLLASAGCSSYESDVKALCNAKRDCLSANDDKALDRDEQASMIADCLSGRIGTDKGRELISVVAAQRHPRQKAPLLQAAAKQVGLAGCPMAEEMLVDLGLPKAPSGCEPLPGDASGVEITLQGGDALVCERLVLKLPPKEELDKGFGERFKPKANKGALEIEPIRDALELCRQMEARVAVAKGGEASSVSALIFVHNSLHPLPKAPSRELVQSIKATGIERMRQVFWKDAVTLCTAPFAPEG